MNDAIDILCEDTLKTLLSGSVFNVCVLEKTDSTNTYVKALAEKGEKEGLVVIAKKQTNGHGRMGRRFYSESGGGLYMSLLLRPSFSPKEALFITCAAAVAVCRAIEMHTNLKPGIKWVNDVFSGDRKLCGILTESSVSPDGQKLQYAVLGIGLNIYSPDGGFSDEIKDIAGCVLEKETENMKNMLAADILIEFWKLYSSENKSRLLEEYKKRSVILGKKIYVIKGEATKEAIAKDIDENFNLSVVYDDETVETLNSGEISIRKI